ncbi:MAG: hypothetical protein KJT03_20020, partial [Verrucomicrobiae bacterium]|nr:hypothetical protein [Verrucomicrobiae bacterium]
PKNQTPPTGFTNVIDPIYDYPRGDGISITGGVVYRGTRLPELEGAYIFGDYGSGRVWALTPNGNSWSRTQIASYNSHYEYGIDPSNGDLLIAGGDGNIRRLVRGDGGEQPVFPETLSATGAFQSLTTLEPENGILAYEPNVSFWSDYAIKSRWVSVPEGQIGYGLNEPWRFPEGTIWIKHFDLPMERGNPNSSVRVETRFLVKTAQGAYGISYRWNEAGTEATLADEAGEDIQYEVMVDGQPQIQTWHIPSRQECLQCHTGAAGYALSFSARQLNRNQMIEGQERNLLEYLSDIEILDTNINNAESVPSFSRADDPEASTLSRVRSYLAVNCVSCHQPGAVASTTWDARPHIPLLQMGIINGLPLNNGGSSDRRLIVPGNAELSVLLSRIKASHGFTRMPNIATNELDQAGIELITDWIESISTGYLVWQDETFEDPESVEADPSADADQDNVINAFEYLVSTDALDAGSIWQIQPQVYSDQLTLVIPVTQNRSYTIQVSSDLETWGTWSAPGNPFAVGDELIASVSVTGSLQSAYFFRVIVGD